MNSYISNFSAIVTDCKEKIFKNEKYYDIILDKTFFYPEGGGQLGDIGTIDGIQVFDTYYGADNSIVHITKNPIKVGLEVYCNVDWKVRYRRMQSHSGEHILSGIIKKLYGFDNIGFHMNDEFITADYNGILSSEDINDITYQCNKVIQDNLEINELIYNDVSECHLDYRSKKDINTNLRLIRIGDIDICACCGTHVKTTSEINLIHIVSTKIIKNTTRITVVIGNRAIEYLLEINKIVNDISNLLSSPVADISLSVNNLILNKKDIEYKLILEKYKYVDLILKNSINNDKIIVADLGSSGMNEINYAIKNISNDYLIIFIYAQDNFLLKLNIENNNDIFNYLFDNKYVLGGGNNNYIQGKLLVAPNIIIDYLKRLIL